LQAKEILNDDEMKTVISFMLRNMMFIQVESVLIDKRKQVFCIAVIYFVYLTMLSVTYIIQEHMMTVNNKLERTKD
jgi:hypothetical protein